MLAATYDFVRHDVHTVCYYNLKALVKKNGSATFIQIYYICLPFYKLLLAQSNANNGGSEGKRRELNVFGTKNHTYILSVNGIAIR